MNYFIKLCLFMSVIGMTPLPAVAEQEANTVRPAELSKIEKTEIRRIEKYLNTIKNVSADFTQVSDMGDMRYGKIALSRPGKMRVDYASPDKDYIIADGSMVHMWDDEMQNQTSIPVGEGIASFILRKNISLTDGNVTITRYARYANKVELSLVSTEEPSEGELTLVLQEKPLKLRQWKVLDPQGRLTGVSLLNAKEDVKFKSNKFVFVSPKFSKERNSGL